MLTYLELTKFRQHESLRVVFQDGLNVLRGANEKGKSTLFEAIRYAFHGSRGLAQSLDEVVTYDNDVKLLKVELGFTHAGVGYDLVRNKSGASLKSDGLLVSGQAEVTSYVEKLFGTNLKTALQVQFASQGQLKDVVDAGVSTIALIESLSGLDEIDNLVSKVQTQLPSGNTSLLESQVSELEKLEVEVLDTSNLDSQIKDLDVRRSEVTSKIHELKRGMDEINLDVLCAEVLKEQLRLQRESQARKTLETMTEVKKPEAPAISQGQLGLLRAEHTSIAGYLATVEAFHNLTSKEHAHTLKSIDSKLAAIIAQNKSDSSSLRAVEFQLGVKSASIVKAGECTLCGKDLSDIPEVLASNAKLNSEIVELRKEADVLKQSLDFAESNSDELQTLRGKLARDLHTASAYGHIEVNSECDRTVFKLSEDLIAGLDGELNTLKLAGEQRQRLEQIQSIERALHSYDKAFSNYVNFCSFKSELVSQLSVLESQAVDITSQQALIEQHHELNFERARLSEELTKITAEFVVVMDKLTRERTLHEAAVTAYERSQEQLRGLQSILSEMKANNLLLKRLRDARPVIGSQLWVIVLSAISSMFSSIRGVPSVVSRNADGFNVNGRPVAGLSGSTKDSLGLAIRWGLQRTFLPLVDFALVDEPAAGCARDREEAMIGQLTSCGYGQVILVTHSDLADAFANNLITL